MRAFTVSAVGDGVFAVAGTDVNWFLLREGSDLTLIDAGYPADIGPVEASIRAIGSQPEDVRAILLTHAHVDHMGAINHFHTSYGTPVYADAIETAHARRDYLEQANERDVARNILRPGVPAWAPRVMRAGATQKISVQHALPVPAGSLDIPGRPMAVPTHGHTSGHSAYFMPSSGAVATGDGLVTGHAVSRRSGPQILPAMFNHDAAETLAALDALAGLDANLLLPGHGPVLEGPISEAVVAAREAA